MPYSNKTNKNIKKSATKKRRRTKAVYFILPFMLIFGACAAYYSGTAASNETRSSASEPQVSSEAQISSSDSGITNSGSENSRKAFGGRRPADFAGRRFGFNLQ